MLCAGLSCAHQIVPSSGFTYSGDERSISALQLLSREAGMVAQQLQDCPSALPALCPTAAGGVDLARPHTARGGSGLLELPVGQCVAKANIHGRSIQFVYRSYPICK
jgi:hypothetical protein